VPLFLARWSAFYGGVRRGEAALACAHPRLGWVHPFADGNGRVMRLHTHTWLTAQGYTGGLWSPLRGFARSTERYYALLADADSLRRGDLDGRGNLSEQALIAWIDYVLDTCLDQVRFMARWSSAGCSSQTRRKARCALACRNMRCGLCSRS